MCAGVWTAGCGSCSYSNTHPMLSMYLPASNIVEHSQMVFDIETITAAVGDDDMDTVSSVYSVGRYSCKGTTTVRTLKGFVEQATVDSKLKGEAFYDSFTNGAGPDATLGAIPGDGRLELADAFWDTHMEAAVAGTGVFSDASLAMRKMFLKKGVLGILTMYTTHELESAISKANDNNIDDASGAPHAWDEGWAFYYGSHPDAGKYSAWEFAWKRDTDFAYDSDGNMANGSIVVSEEIEYHFISGLKASREGDVAAMIEARNNIYRLLALTSIRAALKYAYQAQYGNGGGYSEDYHMEGWVYLLAGAGWIEQAKSGTASAALGLLDYSLTSDQLDSDLYCAVQAALIPAYEALGLDCAKVGTWKSLPGSVSCSNLPACPDTDPLPQGDSRYVFTTESDYGLNVNCGVDMSPHAPLGEYVPASNVIEHSQMVFDIADITAAVGDEDMDTVSSVYSAGRYSCKGTTTARTLKGFVEQATVDSKLKGEAFFDSFTNGAGPDAALGAIPGDGRLELADAFWDIHMEAAIAGTGVFSDASLAMRKMFLKKGVLGILTMYTTHELESAISKANDNNIDDASGAPHAWDEGWAFYYGIYPDSAGKYSAWEFAWKRDLDFAYDSSDNMVSGATVVSEEIRYHFTHGLMASRAGDVDAMIEARNNIYRLLALTSIRAALKYAYQAQYGNGGGYSEDYHMEGWVYLLAGAGWIEQAKSGTASAALGLLDYSLTSDQLDSDLYCAVQAALIPAYEALGLDCAKVGTWKSLPGSVSCSNLPACPDTDPLPQGLTSYAFKTDTIAGANVDCGGVALTDHGTMTTTMMTTAADEDANIAAGLSALSALLVLPVAMLRC
ncbi:CAP-Gly domain [Amphidinium carterae]